MPVEVMARRGRDTLRYGPLKPVGLRDPVTGKDFYAVVNSEKTIRTGQCTISWASRPILG
jgi:methylenetetrahydrofolate--tRNA-(uracil-5-)-methyltransferase